MDQQVKPVVFINIDNNCMLYSHFIKIYLLSFYRSIHVNKIKRIIGLVGYHTISVNQKQTKLCWPIFCVSTCISLSVIV